MQRILYKSVAMVIIDSNVISARTDFLLEKSNSDRFLSDYWFKYSKKSITVSRFF
jgi:hypothetical protein